MSFWCLSSLKRRGFQKFGGLIGILLIKESYGLGSIFRAPIFSKTPPKSAHNLRAREDRNKALRDLDTLRKEVTTCRNRLLGLLGFSV